MRSVTKLIEQVRRQTENEDFDDFVGIKDEEFIQYLNDAQYNLQAAIVHQHPRVFTAEAIINAVDGQESYELPSDCLLANKVHNVEYSNTGHDDDYYVLEQSTIKYRTTGIEGSPTKYTRLGGKLLLAPVPQSGGKLRITYIKRLRELDKRQAQVRQTFGEQETPSDLTISSSDFVINLEESKFETNVEDLSKHDFICIVDKEGRSLVKNIEITNVSLSEISCVGHTLDTGESALVPRGSFIVGGKDTTTHSELDISIERYLIAYCAWKILKRDSSVDSAEAAEELAMMLREIVKSYAMVSDDIQFIPQLNSWDDWSS
tara:strand:+ start:4228 stop:5181 length:954 start_codon:yes stop_codon:yes gene_type:complete